MIFKLKTIIAPFFAFAVLFACILAMNGDALAQHSAPTIIRDTEIEKTLKEWTTPLLSAARLGVNSVDMILVQSPQVNAFVAGGANIFLYTGLIEKTENPGELIGVIAHEMGHIAGGHLVGAKSAYERASYQSILGIVLGIGAAIATGDGQAATAVMAGSQQTAMRGFMAHSRVNESAADQAAFKYMKASGVNPTGLGSFFEKLRGQEYVPESQQVEYVRTHPLTSNRISALETLIATTDLRDKPYPDTWIEQHARMKAKLIGFINPGRVAWEYDDRDQSVAAQYARSIAAYRQNEIPEAISLIDGLIKIEPDNPYFHELKGQMLVDFSRIEEALPSYKRAVALMPEAGLFRIALGHALIESTGSSNTRLKEAIPQLKEALKTEKRSGRVHRLLATAYGRLGEEGMAKLHLAEEAFLERNLSYAGQQAKAAQESFKASSPEWIAARDIITQIENLEPISN